MLLIIIYRSPFFWFFPLISPSLLRRAASARSVGYVLTELGVTVNGQSSSILSVLVLGAGTDYALLLVARYREELRRHEDKHEAMAIALRPRARRSSPRASPSSLGAAGAVAGQGQRHRGPRPDRRHGHLSR